MADETRDASKLAWQACSNFDCFIDWLDHWQTMISGFAAVAAAAVSIHYLRKQISETNKQETRRRSRRLAAARARLQLSLSDGISYANDAIQLLKKYVDQINAKGDVAALASIPRPTLPDQAILSFEAIIEATDDDEFAGYVASMVSDMQVLNSRLQGVATEARALGLPNLHAYIMNAAKIYAYAAGTFKYARRETDTPPHQLDWDLTITGLRLNGLYQENYEELHAFMGRAKDRANAQ